MFVHHTILAVFSTSRRRRFRNSVAGNRRGRRLSRNAETAVPQGERDVTSQRTYRLRRCPATCAAPVRLFFGPPHDVAVFVNPGPLVVAIEVQSVVPVSLPEGWGAAG